MGAGTAAAGSFIQAGSAIGGSLAQAQQYKTQADYEKSVADSNAIMAEIQARDIITRGNKEAEKLKQKGKEIVGAQRTALAAQGIDIESGSALDVQLDTASQIAGDIVTIRNNAWLEAWGLRYQSTQYSFQGQMAYMAGQNKAKTTLLTGGMEAVGYTAQGAGWLSKMGSNKNNYNRISSNDINDSYNDASNLDYFRRKA
jgi:hypothetical protein